MSNKKCNVVFIYFFQCEHNFVYENSFLFDRYHTPYQQTSLSKKNWKRWFVWAFLKYKDDNYRKKGDSGLQYVITKFNWQYRINIFKKKMSTSQGKKRIYLGPIQSLFLPHSFQWNVDTAAQTPLNNENVLSGSSASSAQPVSYQTVNTMFQEWVGNGRKKKTPFLSLRF